PGGTPATSTDSVVTVTYSAPGNYDVILSNTNANGTESKTFPKHVVVLASGPSSQALPAAFDFEGSDPLADWTVLTPNGGNTWIPFDLVGFASNKSVRITNSQNKPGQFHELISPPVDLSNHTGITLKFNLMYRSKNSFNKDKLIITFSKDCGQNWTSFATRIANTTPQSLNTMTTISTGNYIPFTDDDWREESITVPTNFITNNFRFRFSFTTSGGNNIYIDNVRLAGTPTTGLEDPVVAGEILLYPNPAGKEVFIQTSRGQLEEVVIRDVTGKLIRKEQLLPSVNEPHKINTTGLHTGLYIFELTINGNKVRKQVVVKE
ncbi:MAG TPA: choice-of-anchor J domain-containing protein, partial [Catalimonadaceae bacterium]|nr:choice-of-anchor J domain-containing protein [Catalimonadaceae bacterium]